jgi:hypothetical protein
LSDFHSAPCLKWGQYKSKDDDKPDILELEVIDMVTFESQYSTNARVKIKEHSDVDKNNNTIWKEVILPLKSHNSSNAKLLNLWTANIKNGKLQPNRQFKLKTWLGTSVRTKWQVRRFAFKFDPEK